MVSTACCQIVYFEKNSVFKAGVDLPQHCAQFLTGCDLNTLAWDNIIGHWFCVSTPIFERRRKVSFGSRTDVMINRDSWGHSYSMARGEILGFMEDELVRKHLSKMFSLIKNES